MVDAFEIPFGTNEEGLAGGGGVEAFAVGRGIAIAHLVVVPLELVHDVETAVHDERVHVAGFGAKTRDAITALLRGAEFELEERVVFGADDAEVVRHRRMRFLVSAVITCRELDRCQLNSV